MNLYFLVEGRRTEAKAYPYWLAQLLPQLRRVTDAYEVSGNQYYLFSSEGYPSVIYNHLPKAMEEVNEIGQYHYLVMCLDAEELSVGERKQEVYEYLANAPVRLNHKTQFVLIIQNRCIETWFLGNRKVFKRNPEDQDLRQFINFYNVAEQDPEGMGNYGLYRTTAQFHGAYLKKLFRERSIVYSKANPKAVLKAPYLEELVDRNAQVGHLPSFGNFLKFCAQVKSEITE